MVASGSVTVLHFVPYAQSRGSSYQIVLALSSLSRVSTAEMLANHRQAGGVCLLQPYPPPSLSFTTAKLATSLSYRRSVPACVCSSCFSCCLQDAFFVVTVLA